MTASRSTPPGPEPEGNGTGILVPLAEAADRPLEEVGGKARTLGRLLRAGLPVPEGFVLPDPVLAPASRGPGGRGEDRASSDGPPELDPDVARALEGAARRLGPGPLAVRSSAAGEDGSHAFYAGQLRTELDVEGPEALEEAVRRCRAAGAADHVQAYRSAREDADPGGGPPLALIVQRMVPAEASGVAFTADPRTGAREAVVVEAVAGPGEALVSGERTPERWRVVDGKAEREGGPEAVLDGATARRVARLARRAEEALEGPQDVEWAVGDGGELHLLQARPITAGTDVEPVPIPADPPDEGFWFRDEAHFPRPFHPLFASIYVPRYREAVADAFREFGLLVDGLEIREIGGWPYSRIVPPGGREGPAPPSWLLWMLVRLVPPLRAKMRRARTALEEDRADAHVRRWWDEWRPELSRWIRRADAVDLEALGRKALGRRFRETVDTAERALRVHFRLFPPFFLAVSDLVFFCRDELGWEKGRAAEMLGGASEMSAEPGRALEELAREGADDPRVRRILDEAGGDRLERLRREAPEFAERFESYQERYGLRVLHYDFGSPTFRERPEMVLGLVREQMEKRADDGGAAVETADPGEERIEEARGLLEDRPDARARFDELLERARRAYPVREDNEFFALSVLGLLRLTSLETGRRMAAAGHLERPGQVFFLEEDEVTGWLKEPRDLRSVARRREGERRWALAHPGPPSYGEDPGPPPDPAVLPPAGRKVMRALLWTVENDLQTPTPEPEEGRLEGVGASPGRYTGPARIVRSEEEFDKVRSGDVLVCPITSPTWSVVFPSVGALVTDAGGLLSHPAIIAREFGIPAVLATGRATEELSDGEIVTVDGAAGRVEPG